MQSPDIQPHSLDTRGAQDSKDWLSTFKYLRILFSLSLILTFSAQPQHAALANDVAIDNPSSPTIVGGEKALPGEIPWQAGIEAQWFCGGTLIDPAWVVTAAHCVMDSSGVVLSPEELAVTLGDTDRWVKEGTEQNFAVTQVVVHPGYDAQTHDNDAALLRLLGEAVITDTVQAIPLNTADVTGEDGVVSGWGAVSEGAVPQRELMKVTVPVIDNATCSASYPGRITDAMLCAGYAEGGKDSCQGDSGGPLAVLDADNNWKVAGIVSWGLGCARPLLYGVYTRASSIAVWAAEEMKKPLPNFFQYLPIAHK